MGGARRVAHAHPRAQDEPRLKAVGDPAADLTRLPSLDASWPRAMEQVQGNL